MSFSTYSYVFVLLYRYRTASALRTSLMSCLQALLELSLLQEEAADRVLDVVLPQVLSCLDDQNGSTRLAAVHVLKNLLRTKPPSLTGTVCEGMQKVNMFVNGLCGKALLGPEPICIIQLDCSLCIIFTPHDCTRVKVIAFVLLRIR